MEEAPESIASTKASVSLLRMQSIVVCGFFLQLNQFDAKWIICLLQMTQILATLAFPQTEEPKANLLAA
jgi:hypothetical protein